VIADGPPEATKNALALRNATWVDGVCPACGASVRLTAFPELGMIGVTFQHSDSCPVSDLLDAEEP
jgi:hypothetical protein